MDTLLTELPLLLAALSGGALPGLALAWHARRQRDHDARRARAVLARAQGLMDLTQDGVALLAQDGAVLWINARLARWTGQSREALAGRGVVALLPDLATCLEERAPDPWDGAFGPATAAATPGEATAPPLAWPEGQETLLLQADGQRLPVRLDLHHVPACDGAQAVMVAVMRDLRPERDLLRRERLARAELGALLQGGADHLLQLEADALGRVTQVNPGLCRWLGRPARELVGLPCRRLRDRARPVSFWTSLWDGLRLGHAWRGELRLTDALGHAQRLDTLLVPLLDEQGRLRRVIAQMRPPVLEARPSEAATASAPAAPPGRRTDDRISPAPSAPCSGPGAPARQGRRPVDGLALLREVAADLEARARWRGVRLHCRGTALAWVDADPRALRDVLHTLMAHAIEHRDLPGRVDAQARLDGPGDVLLSIEDDGPGWSAPAGRSAAAGAEGSRLVDLQRQVGALGGRLDVDRMPGRGTLVRLRLPVATGLPPAPWGPAPAPAPRPASATRRTEVLVVDDDPTRLGTLRALLADRGGWQLREAAGVPEAIGLIAARTPDLVLVGVPARTLLRALRADADTARVPVVALTTAAASRTGDGPADGAECYDACVPLPITDTRRFLDTLRACLSRPDREPPTP